MYTICITSLNEILDQLKIKEDPVNFVRAIMQKRNGLLCGFRGKVQICEESLLSPNNSHEFSVGAFLEKRPRGTAKQKVKNISFTTGTKKTICVSCFKDEEIEKS